MHSVSVLMGSELGVAPPLARSSQTKIVCISSVRRLFEYCGVLPGPRSTISLDIQQTKTKAKTREAMKKLNLPAKASSTRSTQLEVAVDIMMDRAGPGAFVAATIDPLLSSFPKGLVGSCAAKGINLACTV